jgi:hypothetical protein
VTIDSHNRLYTTRPPSLLAPAPASVKATHALPAAEAGKDSSHRSVAQTPTPLSGAFSRSPTPDARYTFIGCRRQMSKQRAKNTPANTLLTSRRFCPRRASLPARGESSSPTERSRWLPARCSTIVHVSWHCALGAMTHSPIKQSRRHASVSPFSYEARSLSIEFRRSLRPAFEIGDQRFHLANFELLRLDDAISQFAYTWV